MFILFTRVPILDPSNAYFHLVPPLARSTSVQLNQCIYRSSSYKCLSLIVLVDAWESCQGADVLLESPSAMAGVHIAEALREYHVDFSSL